MFHPIDLEQRTRLVAAARGDRPMDLAVLDVRMVNVLTCEIERCDIGIYGNRIALVAPAGRYRIEAERRLDGGGRLATPGLMDAHVHIESSMLTPANYAGPVVCQGTTSVVVDPHEIGNVMGVDGIRAMMEGSEDLPLRVFFAIPSCIPAVEGFETAGAVFNAPEIAHLLASPRAIALAEVMDYVGTQQGHPRMLGIIQAGRAAGVCIQGHAPRQTGRKLQAYIAAGVENDHELRGADDAREKLRRGLLPFVKLGSHGNHLPNYLAEMLQAPHVDVALCTDDVEPGDLLTRGHVNRVVRAVMEYGVPAPKAVRWASYIGAQHYNLRDLGVLAPGRLADIVLFDNERRFEAEEVIVDGNHVVRDGKLAVAIADPLSRAVPGNSVHIAAPTEADFCLKAPLKEGRISANVMALQANRTTRLDRCDVEVRVGLVDEAALPDDVCLISVVPRHGQAHCPSLALLRGIGLRTGAFAHSVAHDSHNILVYGKSAADMCRAVRHLAGIGGGFALVRDGRVVADIPLPLAGLMSLEPAERVAADIERLNREAAASGISIPDTAPIVAGTGLALAVVPAIRITDKHALFDVENQRPIPVFESAA